MNDGNVKGPGCINLAVEQNLDEMRAGEVTASSAYRDGKMREDLLARIADPLNLCDVCKGGGSCGIEQEASQ